MYKKTEIKKTNSNPKLTNPFVGLPMVLDPKTYIRILDQDGKLRAETESGILITDEIEIVSEWMRYYSNGKDGFKVRYIRFVHQDTMYKGHYSPELTSYCKVRPYSKVKETSLPTFEPKAIPLLKPGTIVKYLYRGNFFEHTFVKSFTSKSGECYLQFKEENVLFLERALQFTKVVKIVESIDLENSTITKHVRDRLAQAFGVYFLSENEQVRDSMITLWNAIFPSDSKVTQLPKRKSKKAA